jgi:hypothetical protein
MSNLIKAGKTNLSTMLKLASLWKHDHQLNDQNYQTKHASTKRGSKK